MDSTAVPRPRARPAHTQGQTRCAYTPDGTRLVTAGSNNTIRLYRTGYDGEPTNIDECQEQNTAVAATNDFFVAGSEDGTVSLYSLAGAAFERFLLRCSQPVRDVALSPDGRWCAVASDESTVKVVHVEEQGDARIKTLAEHGRPSKHVSFDTKGGLAAVSCVDGTVYVYSMTADPPELVHRVDRIAGALHGDAEASSRVVWHPDGRAFALATPNHSVQVVSKDDWEKQRVFANGHSAPITALAWSPNGALLATAGRDAKVLVWETKTQSVVARHDYANVLDLAWHPTKNLLSLTTLDGEVYIYPDFVADQFVSLLTLPRQPAPFIHDPLAERSANNNNTGQKPNGIPSRPRRESLGSLDSFFEERGGYPDIDDDDFVVDDDGAGYGAAGVAGPGLGSRKRGPDGDSIFGDHHYPPSKRGRHWAAAATAAAAAATEQPVYHESFQPGATPWRGNRKYLCLNLIGFVWTVDQDSHHTVTVEFYDHDFQRDFHFTDTFLYDKACLTAKGALFASPLRDDQPVSVFYRPHQSWTQRADWRVQLPPGEAVAAMALSDSFVTVVTAASYVRVYTLFGVPVRVYRPKSTPTVTCAAWHDYVLTMGNGPVGPDGTARLLYTIEDVKRDEVVQNEDTVALPSGATVQSVFFADDGNPCIYDSTGTLLTLLHWRRPSCATWVPLLDTKLLPRLATGRKAETYYPIAVADGKFHCIILKGGDRYPYFPRPLLSEFDFAVPLTSAPPGQGQKKTTKRRKKSKQNNGGDRSGKDDDEDGNGGDEDGGDTEMDGGEDVDVDADADDGNAETRRLEQAFLLQAIRAAQARDVVESSGGDGGSVGRAQRAALGRLELDLDKTLLQMLAGECRAGEERGPRALELVELMRDQSGKMVEAAEKVAQRYGHGVLGEKIREIGERRMGGVFEEETNGY